MGLSSTNKGGDYGDIYSGEQRGQPIEPQAPFQGYGTGTGFSGSLGSIQPEESYSGFGATTDFQRGEPIEPRPPAPAAFPPAPAPFEASPPIHMPGPRPEPIEAQPPLQTFRPQPLPQQDFPAMQQGRPIDLGSISATSGPLQFQAATDQGLGGGHVLGGASFSRAPSLFGARRF